MFGRKRWILLAIVPLSMIVAAPSAERKTVPPPPEQSFSGTVTAVNEHTCEICKWIEISATLDTGVETLEIRLGPKIFLDKSHFSLSYGDAIVATGVRFHERGKEVVLVNEIQRGKERLVLRGKDGKPAWIGERGHLCPVCGN